METEKNKVTISGEVVRNFTYSHELYGEKFYTTELMIRRLSGTNDIIPVMAAEKLIDIKKDYKGCNIIVNGQYRSHNMRENDKNRLILTVFVKELSLIAGDERNQNNIYLDGFLCKKPVYRKTPFGREIADMLLAVNRPYGKSDYIPCIYFGKEALYMEKNEVGTHIHITGRIQSRKYNKKTAEKIYEQRTAYEVAAANVNVVE